MPRKHLILFSLAMAFAYGVMYAIHESRSVNDQASELESRIDDVSSQVDDVESGLEDVKSTIDDVESDLDDVKSKVDF